MKVIYCGILFLLAFSLVSCSSKDSSKEMSTSPTQAATTTPTTSTIKAPGTLPDVEDIEQPDDSKIGTKAIVNFNTTGESAFIYYYNTETSEERLVCIKRSGDMISNSSLYVYDTNLQGYEGLRNSLENGSVEATIVANAAISAQEANSLFVSIVYGQADYAEVEKNLVSSETIGEGEQIFLGAFVANTSGNQMDKFIWSVRSDGTAYMINGAIAGAESQGFANSHQVFEKIVQRYGISLYE